MNLREFGSISRPFTRGRSLLFTSWLVAVAASASNLTPESQAVGRAREFDLKAAFLYRFVQFISWPEDAFTDASAPFVIGVLGDDPFGQSLDGILDGERVGTRSIVLQRFETLPAAGDAIEVDGLRFEVLAVEDRRIVRVAIRRLEAQLDAQTE